MIAEDAEAEGLAVAEELGDLLGVILGVALSDGVGERNKNNAPFLKSGGTMSEPVCWFICFSRSFTNSEACRAPESCLIFSATFSCLRSFVTKKVEVLVFKPNYGEDQGLVAPNS